MDDDIVFDGDYVVVYTDGCCLGNGMHRPKAGIGVWWNDDHPLNVSQPVRGKKATNNEAEIQAAIKAIQIARHQLKEFNLKIITDSQFLIDCIEKFIPRWKKNKWRNSRGERPKNYNSLQKLDYLINEKMDDVELVHVYGHSRDHGNDEADALARKGARKYIPR